MARTSSEGSMNSLDSEGGGHIPSQNHDSGSDPSLERKKRLGKELCEAAAEGNIEEVIIIP